MSYGNSSQVKTPEIKKILYYGQKWYVVLHDVRSSSTLGVEKLYIDGSLTSSINAGTNAADHRRVFSFTKKYDKNLCHTAYIVLYNTHNNIVSKSKEIHFGNRSKCTNNSTVQSSNAETPEIKKILYYGKKWYVVLQDVSSSSTLSVEKLYIDGGLTTSINAGTNAADHKRVFSFSKKYNPNLCHTAYIVLYNTQNHVVSKSKKIQFGNKHNCSNTASPNVPSTQPNNSSNNNQASVQHNADYYISLNGSDSNNGKSLNNAFKTIAHALATARGGDTILMKGGVYRQGNILYNKRDKSGKYITLQNYNGEKVTIKGSKVVRSWEHYRGNIWKLVSGDNSGLNRKVHYQQVFYGNGKSLQKIGYPNYIKQGGKYIWQSPYKRYVPIKENSRNPFGMSEGTFYVKELSNGNHDLYVWLPNGKTPIDSDVTMEVSDAQFILYAYDVDHLKLKGLSFMHSSSAGFGNFKNGFQGGVGVSVGRYAIVEDCDISYMDFAGLSLSLGGQGHRSENMHQTVKYSKIHHNGAVGISSTTGGFLIVENEFYENGHRPFIQYWHTGAIKTSAGGWGKVLDNYIHDEHAQGIWFDSCHSHGTNRIEVSRNYLDGIGYRNNPLDQIHIRGHGIFFEQSSNILISNNIVNRAIIRGIYISLSQNVQVINNLVRKSNIEQLGVRYRDDLGLKLSNVSITDNIFLDKVPNKYMDVKVFYETDRDAIFNPNNVFKNNIIYNSNGIYKGDFSTSHWSFNENLKGVNPLFLTHGSSRLDEWTIDNNSPLINTSVSGKHLKYDFRRVLRNRTRPMNMGPFEQINGSDYTKYKSSHKKFNTYK